MTDDNNLRSEAFDVIKAAERWFTPQIIPLDNGKQLVTLPKGVQLHSVKPLLDEYLKRPERIIGCAALDTLDSFIQHIQRFKRPSTAVYASTAGLRVVYDYHDVLPAIGDTPDNCDHQAWYGFPMSTEWRAWMGAHGVEMPQRRFAEFIEERVADIATPKDSDSASYFGELGFNLASPSTMLGLSRGLTVRVDCEAVHKTNLSSGEVEVVYKENHADAVGAPLKIPGGFMLRISPFVDGVLYRIPVRLRYKVSGGKVIWTVMLYRADAVLRDAIKDACNTVVDKTQVPVFYGAPEKMAPTAVTPDACAQQTLRTMR
jgi:uncharacterized protein YfdQ (DUF2303 family)